METQQRKACASYQEFEIILDYLLDTIHLVILNYNLKHFIFNFDFLENEVLDNEYPVWTESTWLDINVRYFLKPNSNTEVIINSKILDIIFFCSQLAVLLSGILVFGVSLVGSFFLSKRSHLLFEYRSTGSL